MVEVRLVTDPSSGYVVHPQFYASKLVEYTQVNNVFGGGRQIGIKVDILINVDGPSLKYQTAQVQFKPEYYKVNWLCQ